MLRKKVEIEGKSFTLGEATAGVLEDAQDAEAAMLCVRRLEHLGQKILTGHAPHAVPEKAALP